MMTSCNHAFSNPVDTKRWNSDSGGHDYRFKHNIPKVKQERKIAEAMSKMGDNPFGTKNDIEQYGEGVSDAESRSGLS